jgi:hypothetical protein
MNEQLFLRQPLGRQQDTLVALNSIFLTLKVASTEDYSGLALKCLETTTNADPPLWYLEERGNTQGVYDKLKAMAVPEQSRPAQRAALNRIAARIHGRTQ